MSGPGDRVSPTRVIVPYTILTRGCEQSLERYAPHAERVYVGADPCDYWRLMCRVWADGEDFILIEHDIEFEADTLDVLHACPWLACTIPGYFRLTRFRSEMMRAIPDVFEALPVAERHWIPLEWMARTRMERAGFYLHSHLHEAVADNPTRGLNGHDYAGLYTSADRWPVWCDWCLTTLPEHEWPDAVKQYATDQGRPCRDQTCRRRMVALAAGYQRSGLWDGPCRCVPDALQREIEQKRPLPKTMT